MISIRKFLNAGGKTEPVELIRVVRLLMQGIGLHAVEGEPQEYQSFRRDVQQQVDSIEGDPSVTDLMLATGALLKSLESYNGRATRHLRMQGAELQHMITMLTHTVATLGAGNQESVDRLRSIEGQIEKTSAIEDVRVLKLRLAECLESIRNEVGRQRSEGSRTVAALQEHIRATHDRISSAGAGVGPVLDPTTGLPAREAAVAAIEEWALRPKPPYAALFVVDRVPLINVRFGHALGDRVLCAYLEELRNHLTSGDQIFRWSGPSFLVLLMRADRIEHVREELRFTLPGKLERNFELSNRSAMLAISATWTVFPMSVSSENLIEQLDTFLATQNTTA